VLVFGSGLTTLGTIRLLASAGLKPFVVSDTPGMVAKSRWYRPAPRSASSENPRDNLRAWLRGLALDRAILLACSDEWILRVARCADEFRERFPTSVSSPAVLETLIDKARLAAVLTELGLPQPRTTPLDLSTDLAEIPDSTLAGAFIKPRESTPFFRRFQVKGFHVTSRAELRRRLEELSKLGIAVELQEFIPGPPSNYFYVEGFIDSSGQMSALFTRQRLRMDPADFGNSTLFRSVHPSLIPGAIETATRLLRHLKFRGIFSVELKRDERDGVYRLIEVNARPWWYVEFAGQCGVNLAAMHVADALGEPVVPVREFTVGKACVYPLYDFHACTELRAANKLTMREWAATWLMSTQPVARWNDPMPASGMVGIVLRRLAKSLGIAKRR
jgi:predicted ATP-grasp superfamily ATP-dependent carboligase